MAQSLARVFVLVFCALLTVTLLPQHPTQAQSDELCFDGIQHCISGRFREYWEQNGGLPVFGYPITPQQEETIGDWTGQVQWFERNRFELHPENDAPYDVLLGRLGGEHVEASGAPPREEPREGCTYFNETGFNVCSDVLDYWSANGLELDGQPGKTAQESIALFGFPLTGEFETTLADGNTYTVQWFERARFERHPENAPPNNVLLGRLGVEQHGEPPLTETSDEDAIKAAVRAHVGDAGFPYEVLNICTDQGFAAASVVPLEEGRADTTLAILEKVDGQWTVIHFGPGIPTVAFFEDLGLPLDFACLTPVDA
jgi:hypothetical protein